MSAQKIAFSDDVVSIHYIICECGETFATENGLREHLEKEHPLKRERKEFKCGVCGSVFPSEVDCISHYEEAHLEPDEEVEDEFEDKMPEEELHMVTDYEEEVGPADIKPDNITHDQDEFQLQAEHEEEVEEETEHKPQIVDNQETISESDQQYIVKVSGDQQIYYVQTTPTDQQNEEHQEVCEIDSTSQHETARATQAIVRTENAPNAPTQLKPPTLKMVRDPETGALVLVLNRAPIAKARKKHTPPAAKSIVCETCGNKYASAAALKYHQRVHTGDKPYQCHLCPKAFTMPLFLQIHVRTHTGEKPYQCPECPKAFSNRAALLRHERVHSGAKPYRCPMCLKCFTQSNSMKLHVATVHLKQPAPYKSHSRRAKERKHREANEKPAVKEQIKAFAPQANKYVRLQPKDAYQREEYEMIISEPAQDDQMNCYEVVYEEEIH